LLVPDKVNVAGPVRVKLSAPPPVPSWKMPPSLDSHGGVIDLPKPTAALFLSKGFLG
jgi:hypothetical protein